MYVKKILSTSLLLEHLICRNWEDVSLEGLKAYPRVINTALSPKPGLEGMIHLGPSQEHATFSNGRGFFKSLGCCKFLQAQMPCKVSQLTEARSGTLCCTLMQNAENISIAATEFAPMKALPTLKAEFHSSVIILRSQQNGACTFMHLLTDKQATSSHFSLATVARLTAASAILRSLHMQDCSSPAAITAASYAGIWLPFSYVQVLCAPSICKRVAFTVRIASLDHHDE